MSHTMLLLTDLEPHPNNPRKHFDQGALEELAASIRESGVLTELLVRPFKGAVRYQIIAGERRWRAAKIAGLAEVPVQIRQMSDAEAELIMTTDNLHRVDLHPMEEATGYQELMKALETQDPADIARQVGKTTPYVAQRLKLLELEPDCRLVFSAGLMTLGHALLLARLQPDGQAKALRHLVDTNGYYRRRTIEDLVKEYSKNRARALVTMTETALKNWIGDNLVLTLKGAPWDLEDAALVPSAGACTTCPKRSGANAALFADMTAKEDDCLDASCYQAKRKALVQLKVAASRESGDALRQLLQLSTKHSGKKIEFLTAEKGKQPVIKSGQWLKVPARSCPDARPGIFVDDSSRWSGEKFKAGQIIHVCANQACKKHKHTVDRPIARVAGESVEDQAKRRAEQEAKGKALVALEKKIRFAILERLEAKGAAKNTLWAAKLICANSNATVADVAEKMGIKAKTEDALIAWATKAKPEELQRLAFYALVLPEVTHLHEWSLVNDLKRNRADLWAIAKAAGVDPDPIAHSITTQEKAEKPKAKAAKKR